MKLNLITPALILIILVLSVFLFKSCDRNKELQDDVFDATRKAEKVEARERAASLARDSAISIIQVERKISASKDSLAKIGLKMREKAWQRKYSSLKTEIQPISDSIPAIQEFVAASDSLISVKDSLILHEQMVNMLNSKSYQQEIALLNQNVASQKQIGDAWRYAAESSDKKLRKETRKKKFFRTVSVVLLGVAGLLAVSQ